jgi:large subunit ribosomal protein L17
MRHRDGIKKLNRNGAHRRSTLRNMTIALIEHERIHTTHVKAKVLRGFAERLITLAKRGDLQSRRLAARHVHNSQALIKLFDDLGKRFANRPGGYTRVLKLGARRGDNGMTALIELVDRAAPTPEAAPAQP